jgi:hypothetical protein
VAAGAGEDAGLRSLDVADSVKAFVSRVTLKNLLTCIIHKLEVGETELKNASREKAGMDEVIISGLRERVHSGLPPARTRFVNNTG